MGRMESAPGPTTTIGGKSCLYFGGTGYFGLHGHPEVIQAGIDAFRRYGTHSATSRSGFGNNPALVQVEERLKKYFNQEEAAYFGSGYLSSLVLAQALSREYNLILIDESAHFCLHDAARAVMKPVFTFRHRDPEGLKRLLKTNLKPGQRPFLLTDGVFPTFGAIAPLPDYAGIIEPYDGIIGLDDAHGAGVLGPNGRGTIEYFGLKSEALYFCGTLSKAFGGHGGFVVGKDGLIARIKRAVGAFIGSTPTPTPIAAATAKGIEILSSHPEMRERLRQNVILAKSGLKKLGIKTDDTPVPIVAWSLRSEQEMKKAQKKMMARGIAIPYLKYAGAPAKGVLRITIFSTHTPDQIGRLVDTLKQVL